MLAVTVLSISPSANAEYAGRVHKEHNRVVRPLPEDQIAPVLDPQLTSRAVADASIEAGVTDDSFVLKAGDASGSIPSSAEEWNPWSGKASRHPPIPTFVATRAPQAQMPEAVDYAAVEQTYAAAAPQVVVRPASSSRGGIPIPMPIMGATGVMSSGAGVDYDHCACGTAMPSDNCVRSRMTNFGVRTATANTVMATGAQAPLPAYGRPGYSSPVVAPAISAVATPTLVVPGGTLAPVVLPSAVVIPAGAGFANQIR